MNVETPLPIGTLIRLCGDETRHTRHVGVVTDYQHDADLGWMHCLLVCGDFVWARECDLGEVIQ
mgnify:CR=1 FL=1|jgi:hypothetical protein